MLMGSGGLETWGRSVLRTPQRTSATGLGCVLLLPHTVGEIASTTAHESQPKRDQGGVTGPYGGTEKPWLRARGIKGVSKRKARAGAPE